MVEIVRVKELLELVLRTMLAMDVMVVVATWIVVVVVVR